MDEGLSRSAHFTTGGLPEGEPDKGFDEECDKVSDKDLKRGRPGDVLIEPLDRKSHAAPNMKVIILAAGYATRLYPLTLTQPKPLLPVAGKPMVEYVLDNVLPVGGIDEVFIVTNAKFAGHFERWAQAYSGRKEAKITVVNDGSTDENNRRGAIGDVHFVVQKHKVDDDLIVVAGDNLFSESLQGFGEFCRQKQAPVVAIYDVKDLELVKKYNSLTLAPNDGRITFFQEKASEPTSTWSAIALYYYPRAVVPMIDQYIREGNNPDQPGRLIQWLFPRVPVYTWPVPGLWYDIGSKESLEEANRIFAAPQIR